MALQVWLPLSNGKFHNYGLDNSQPGGASFSVENDGILGKCIKTSNSYLATNYNGGIINTGSISFGGWFKFNKSEIGTVINALTFDSSKTYATGNLIGNSSYGGIGLIWSSNNMYTGGPFTSMSVMAALRTSAASKLTTSLQITFDAWTHIFMVYDKGLNKEFLYINGALFAQTSTHEFTNAPSTNININSASVWGGNGPGASIPFYINDIRLYDHALTEKDVKRICQKKIFDLMPYSGVKNVLFDKSGLCLMPLVNNNAVFQNNALYFNGTNAMLRPKNGNVGFTMDDGTLSVWFSISTAPTGYQMLYIDSVSKFSIGFLNSGSFIVTCNNSAMPTFSASHVKYDGSINSIIVSYNTSKTPQFCLINGIQEANVATNNWTETSGLTIGSRMYNTANSNFKGKIFKVGVYNRQFTQDEAVKLYNSERGMFLPDDYIQLEYIQSTGTQWIDTGIKGHMNYTYELEFQQTDTGNYRNWGVFGQSSYVGPNMSLTYASGFALRWENLNNNQSLINSISSINTNKHFVKIVNGQLYWDGVNKGKSVGHKNDFVINYNLFLGTVNPGGTTPSANAKSKYYLYKVYDENGILIQNFIPAKRKSDNVIGMYDIVSRQFFTNAGTGSFTGA